MKDPKEMAPNGKADFYNFTSDPSIPFSYFASASTNSICGHCSMTFRNE